MTNKTTTETGFAHQSARNAPRGGHEAALVGMLRALEAYAEAHHRRFKSPIGEDYVLGESWADALRGLRGLLNGERGRLDGGSMDSEICALAKKHGVDLD